MPNEMATMPRVSRIRVTTNLAHGSNSPSVSAPGDTRGFEIREYEGKFDWVSNGYLPGKTLVK